MNIKYIYFAEIWRCDTILRRDYAMTSSRNDITTSFSNFWQEMYLPLATFSENELQHW